MKVNDFCIFYKSFNIPVVDFWLKTIILKVLACLDREKKGEEEKEENYSSPTLHQENWDYAKKRSVRS